MAQNIMIHTCSRDAFSAVGTPPVLVNSVTNLGVGADGHGLQEPVFVLQFHCLHQIHRVR